MIRVAGYARYSSDLQKATSIDDQIRLCRERAEREGWEIVNFYTDAEISGDSVLRRPGVQMLTLDAMAGKFDVVLSESLDRVSRDLEDVAGIFKRLKFSGVKMITLSEGEITELHIGLKGTMNQLFLKDLRFKVKRGQRGRIEKGKNGGGNSFGYDVVKELDSYGERIRGERVINAVEAPIVQRIFKEFRQGTSPKAIAAGLNADRIPSPRSGTGWSQSTINGNWQRGTGILNNELYIGQLVWNRVSYPKNPDTGKRVTRLNPESEWVRTEVPALRIIDQELWDAVKARQKKARHTAHKFWSNQRPRYVFSFLLKCGCCGGGVGKMSNRHYGCSTARNKGEALCSNRRTIKQADLEHTVLTVLQERLMDATLVAKFCAEYTKHLNRLRMERNASIVAYQAELAKSYNEEARMVRAIRDGFASPQLKRDMDALLARQDELVHLLETTEEAPVLLHPNMAERYRQEVTALVQSLNDEEHRHEAVELIRSLVDRIVLTPDPKSDKAVLIDVYGDLAGVLNVAVDRKKDQELDLKQIRLVVGLPEPVDTGLTKRKEALARNRVLQASNMAQSKLVAAEGSLLILDGQIDQQGKLVAAEPSKLDLQVFNILQSKLVEPIGIEPTTS